MPMGLRILVVGVGGLGCELLKLLAQDKACRITIIDDDTIDATNLNRQFLFTHLDVGQSKAECAAKKLSHRNLGGDKHPGADGGPEIVALRARVQMYPKVEFYKNFDIVYNCLDNNETRSFVNQRCRLAGVLMIDGGSAGWLGQSFHAGGECFDCLPQKTELSIPLCTIRQNPSEFKHCLAWALAVVNSRDIDVIYEDLLGVVPQKLAMQTKHAEDKYAKITGKPINTTRVAVELDDNKASASILSAINNPIAAVNITAQSKRSDNGYQIVDDTGYPQCKRQKIGTAPSKNSSCSHHSSESESFSDSVLKDPCSQYKYESFSNAAASPDPERFISLSNIASAGTELTDVFSSDSQLGSEHSNALSSALSSDFSSIPLSLLSSSDLESYPPPKYVIDTYVNELKNLGNHSRSGLVYNLASLKARKYNVKRMSYMESQQIIEKIIPSICTTNSMIAALMIVSARTKRSYYLVQSGSKFVPMDLNRSSINCLTCSVPVYRCEFPRNTKMSDIITQFGAITAVTETAFYDPFSNALIDELDGHFAILYRNELPFRFYFEMIERDGETKGPVINITRVK